MKHTKYPSTIFPFCSNSFLENERVSHISTGLGPVRRAARGTLAMQRGGHIELHPNRDATLHVLCSETLIRLTWAVFDFPP